MTEVVLFDTASDCLNWDFSLDGYRWAALPWEGFCIDLKVVFVEFICCCWAVHCCVLEVLDLCF
jgi:hypothetical protein